MWVRSRTHVVAGLCGMWRGIGGGPLKLDTLTVFHAAVERATFGESELRNQLGEPFSYLS
jgi:hypothetical protein